MIYPHHFPVGLSGYAELGRANEFPDIECCPICRAKSRLLRHGFYDRNAIEDDEPYRIPICRLLCPDCGKTVSMGYMIRILLAYWLTSCLMVSRQLRRFYEKRIGKQTEVEFSFVKRGSARNFRVKAKKEP